MSQPIRIVVVDDDPAILQLVSTILRAHGYEVLEAATAHQGLQLTREQHPDLVLLDVMLPDLSGLEVCRRIKADSTLQDVFVVLISGRADGTTQQVEGLASGADDYLTQPLDPAELLARIRTMLWLRKATTAFRDSELPYRHLLEILPDAFGLISPEGRLLAVNPQAVGMLGYPEAAELLQKNVFDLFPAQARDRIEAELNQTLETGFLRNAQYTLLKKGGHQLPVEVCASVLKDSQGRELGIVCVVRDTTERKQAEQSLRESEDRYRQLAESSPDAICILDRAAIIQYVNPVSAQWFDAPAAELLGRTQTELLPPEVAHCREQSVRHVFDTGEPFQREEWISFPQGIKWVEVRLVPIRAPDGRVMSVMGISRDLTGRKQAEQQLRRLLDAVQSTDELISITDPENRLTFVNRAFLAAYGYEPAEVLGRTPDFLQSTKNPPDRCEHVFRATLAGGFQGENLNRRKDGTEFPIFLSTACIKDDEGRPLGFVGVARDISEHTKSEKQRAAFSQLGHRLSAAIDVQEAAKIILEIASGLLGWDAAYVHLYSHDEDKIIPVLTMDTLNGRQSPVEPTSFTYDPSPLMRLVMAEGARLINREKEAPLAVNLVPFGDAGRRSASMMYVPVRSGGSVLGILSVQSYTLHAYSPADLQLLQTLADHCGDALHRIKVTAALRETEDKYRNIVENAVEGIFQSTPDGRYIRVNPAMARLLGYETPEEVIAGVTDIAHQVFAVPERWEEFKRLVESRGSVERFESEHRRKAGNKFWMSVNARAVRDAESRVLFYEGTALDTTELKWAEQVRQFQRDFGIFLSSANDLKAVAERLLILALRHEGIDCGAVYLVVPKTTALELVAHEGFSAHFAGRAGDHSTDPGRSPSPSPGGTMVALVEQLEREGLRAWDVLPLQHKGRVVAVLSLGSHVVDEIPVKSFHAVDAIAAMAGGAFARIHAERSLQASQQLIEKTLHSLHAAVFVLDPEPVTILECNPAATRIFGYSRAQMIGRSPAMLHLDDVMHEQFQAHLLAAVEDKGILSDFEFRMKRKDGTVFPSEHNVVPIKDEKGEVVNWVYVVRDRTQVKRAEDELRTLSRRIIEAQETERQRVARELHDGVNQVIASANLRLNSVEENVAAQFPAAREILARCSRLLVQALEENRRIAHNLRPADLDQLGLAAACRNFCNEFQARTGLAMKCRIGRQIRRLPPAVELNLFRIVQESLTNVEKHARAKSVRFRLALQDGSILLRIQDDGRGFDPGQSNVTKGRVGIGLTNVRERAASLGGTCELKSVPKRGTSITVSVPCKFVE